MKNKIILLFLLIIGYASSAQFVRLTCDQYCLSREHYRDTDNDFKKCRATIVVDQGNMEIVIFNKSEQHYKITKIGHEFNNAADGKSFIMECKDGRGESCKITLGSAETLFHFLILDYPDRSYTYQVSKG
jgi:hypothetical protein